MRKIIFKDEETGGEAVATDYGSHWVLDDPIYGTSKHRDFQAVARMASAYGLNVEGGADD